jgi:acetylglutamate kinase
MFESSHVSNKSDQNLTDDLKSETDASEKIIVVKIGGSTLGDHDTSINDIISLHQNGYKCVVVHGGGPTITSWMGKQNIRPKFVDGLRVTDEASLEIVVAVLTGLINKNLVAQISAYGGNAIGICGADKGLLKAKITKPELGFVGTIKHVDIDPIMTILASGSIPVIAPIAIESKNNRSTTNFSYQLLNVNADTAAGEISVALNADRMIFLTDVAGVLDSSRRLIPRLTLRQAEQIMHSSVVAGGMVPKIEACITSIKGGGKSFIADGRKPNTLQDIIDGKSIGTRIN